MTEAAVLYEVTPTPPGSKSKPAIPDMQQLMLHRFLGNFVRIHLVNGIRLVGKLTGFDKFAVILDGQQLIFKSAISTISPDDKRYFRDENHHA